MGPVQDRARVPGETQGDHRWVIHLDEIPRGGQPDERQGPPRSQRPNGHPVHGTPRRLPMKCGAPPQCELPRDCGSQRERRDDAVEDQEDFPTTPSDSRCNIRWRALERPKSNSRKLMASSNKNLRNPCGASKILAGDAGLEPANAGCKVSHGDTWTVLKRPVLCPKMAPWCGFTPVLRHDWYHFVMGFLTVSAAHLRPAFPAAPPPCRSRPAPAYSATNARKSGG